MIKISTLTYSTAHNYGALLQTFALKHFLENNYDDVDVKVVNYASDMLVDRYRFFPYYMFLKGKRTFFSNAKSVLHNIVYLCQFLKRKKNMNLFIRDYIELGRPIIKKTEDMRLVESDLYIVGSDQVWNTAITLGYDDVFWGNFPRRGDSVLISYAASTGKEEMCDEKERVGNYWNGFDAISVREKSSIEFIKNHTITSVVTSIDPVFLVSRSDWERIAILPKIKGYVLLLYTEKDEELIHTAFKIANKVNTKVVCLNYTKTIESVAYAGPREMLGFIINSSYVVTNSFHGCAFSIILNKKMYIKPTSEYGNRISDLLEEMNITIRKGEDGEIYNDVCWENVDKTIEVCRDQARNYLGRFINELQECKKY